MKTKTIESNLPFQTKSIVTPLPRWCRWKATTLAAIAALLLPAFAQAAPPRPGTISPPCAATALLMHYAERREALADYDVALATANNEPTAAARTAGRKQAALDYKDALATVREQFLERRELCRALGEERYNPTINPADFLTVAEIVAQPNPFFPLIPGTTYNYRALTAEGTETIAFEVTSETRTILGIACIVVRDTVLLDGALLEDTVDWFAQDRSGNVWYFGENTAEYEGGLITTMLDRGKPACKAPGPD